MGKKNEEPGDRLEIYAPFTIHDILKELGKERGLSKNKMALLIIKECEGMYRQEKK